LDVSNNNIEAKSLALVNFDFNNCNNTDKIMEFLAKLGFYGMFGISGLICLFNLANSAYTATAAYGKTSESIILGIAGLLIALGMYFTYHQTVHAEKYILGCGLLGLTWLVVIIELFVGFFFFNGPIHWQ